MATLDLRLLNSVLENVGGRWRAGSAAEHRLGFVPGPADHSLEQREQIAVSNFTRFVAMSAAMAAAPPSYPPAVDWRNYPPNPPPPQPLPPGNYVTPIRDQGSCGSCVAFGTLAAFESAVRIKAKNPAQAVDLSEADLFYCHAEAEQGRHCDGPNGGWWPAAALACCQNPGVVDEQCFPYTPGDQACNRCNNWQTRLTKIGAWHSITDATLMKQWLASNGPLITCITVYSDFFNYQSGIYQHVTGGVEGGHCICCVGYNDAQRYWICKNSWGPGWGEQGFFNIAYGQVGVDATMWALQL